VDSDLLPVFFGVMMALAVLANGIVPFLEEFFLSESVLSDLLEYHLFQ
jgi:hypothetical protein